MSVLDEDFVPVGFDLKDFGEESSDSSARVSAMIQREERISEGNTPNELQYERLLTKAMNELRLLREAREGSKFKLPLEVKRNVPTKTSINLREIATHLKRDEDHLLKFVLNELLTTGSLNQEGKLYMKGRFTKAQIQDILREYVELFVMCKSCMKSDSTELVKENKMVFLKCEGCGGSRHVGSIVEGYKTPGRGRTRLKNKL